MCAYLYGYCSSSFYTPLFRLLLSPLMLPVILSIAVVMWLSPIALAKIALCAYDIADIAPLMLSSLLFYDRVSFIPNP